ESCSDAATAATSGSPVTRRALVDLLRENGAARRHDRDAERVSARLQEGFPDAEFWRRMEHAWPRVRMVLKPEIGAIDADDLLRPVIPGRDVIVGDRPVDAEAVARVGLEVVRPHAEGVARPVIGAPAQH